jgi:hypothetical protein
MHKVAVVDDRPDFVEKAATAVRDNTGVDPERVTGNALIELVDTLVELQNTGGAESQLDSIDLFILDYDLRTEGSIGLTTGADIAKLLRSFTCCGAIVLTNAYPGQNREHRIDLQLVGDLDLMCDFEIASEFLGNPGLWRAAGWPFFRPWQWPLLTALPQRLDECTKLLAGNLDQLVCDIIPGLRDHLTELSSEDLLWLGSDATMLRVRDIADGSRFSGLSPSGGAPIPERVIPRLAASRLMKWFDQFVLVRGIGAVDEPHLITRRPEVLLKNADLADRNHWSDLLEPVVAEAANRLGPWCSRPAWWVGDLDQEPVEAVLNSKPLEGLDEVFCEDASRFLNRSQARSYRLEIPSAYGRRWLANDQLFADELGEYQPDYQPEQWLLT